MMTKQPKLKRRNAADRRKEHFDYKKFIRLQKSSHNISRHKNQSRNFWIIHRRPSNGFKYQFSKISPTEAELAFIKLKCPNAILEYRFVNNHKKTGAYRADYWDGKAWFVSFNDSTDSYIFRNGCLR